MDNGNLQLPALAKSFSSKVETALDQAVIEDHEVTDGKKCAECKGRGLEDGIMLGFKCQLCEGTGWTYSYTYGVRNGKTFAIFNEYGLDLIKEYCRQQRDGEFKGAHLKRAGTQAFVMPDLIRLELIEKGYDIQDWEDESNIRAIAKALKKEYGQTFLTTNLI